ncbi:MAG: methyltransferase domain-containing protein [Acidobacteriota bacterium]
MYPSNVPRGEALQSGEVACTSPYLSSYDDIYFCRPCGLGRSAPPVHGADIEELYRQVQDPAYLISEEERRSSFREALVEIERYHRPGRLLEVGAALGLFLEEARQRGWEVIGIEPSLWASEQARRRNLEIHTGTLDDFDPGGEQFDVVALWDVLEHLADPLAALRRISELLKSGGILGFTTVNIGGLGAKLFRRRWPWLMRMHLHYFTRQSLKELVRREGFQLLRLSTQPKVLKLGYVLDRARGMFGRLAVGGGWVAEKLRLADYPVKVNLGDILFVVARKA